MCCCHLGALDPCSVYPSPLGTTRLKSCVFGPLRPVVSVSLNGWARGMSRGGSLDWELE